MAITDKTLVPLGLAVMAIGGASIWLTNVYATGIQNRDAIVQIQVDRAEAKQKYIDILIQINSRLAKIETKLERLK